MNIVFNHVGKHTAYDAEIALKKTGRSNPDDMIDYAPRGFTTRQYAGHVAVVKHIRDLCCCVLTYSDSPSMTMVFYIPKEVGEVLNISRKYLIERREGASLSIMESDIFPGLWAEVEAVRRTRQQARIALGGIHYRDRETGATVWQSKTGHRPLAFRLLSMASHRRKIAMENSGDTRKKLIEDGKHWALLHKNGRSKMANAGELDNYQRLFAGNK